MFSVFSANVPVEKHKGHGTPQGLYSGSYPVSSSSGSPTADVTSAFLKTSDNIALVKHIQTQSRANPIAVCGQALSHCVNYSVRDLKRLSKDANIVVLRDASSTIPGFEKTTAEFLNWCETESIKVMTIAEFILYLNPNPNPNP